MEPVGFQNDFYHVYPMSDAVIGALPEMNLVYTMEIKDAQGTTVETRTRTLPKHPYKVSEVDSSYFLQVSGIPDHNTSSLHLGGGTLSFTYAKPTAYQAGEIIAEVGYWDNLGSYYNTDKNIPHDGTSANIVTPGLPDGFVVGGGELRTDVRDLYGRDVSVSWQFSPTSTTPFGEGSAVSKSSIVGSWGDGVTGNDVLSITFYPDDTYIHYQKDDKGCPTCTGVEYGTYSYDSEKNVLTITPTVDENAYYGLSNPQSDSIGGVGKTVTWSVTVSGDTMNITILDLNDQPATVSLKRVVDANNPIVGGWDVRGTADDVESLTFYPNGSYIHWGDGDAGCTQKGVEYAPIPMMPMLKP